jgi:putative FmdB family regulatory protein
MKRSDVESSTHRVRNSACYNLAIKPILGGSTLPLYEYECVKCHKKTEKIEKVDGPHLKKCPHCGGKVEPLISRSAIQFKGAGWYVTDYAGKKSATDAGGSGGSSEKGEGKDSASKEGSAKDSKESKESKDSKESKESKPAAEKKTEKKKS